MQQDTELDGGRPARSSSRRTARSTATPRGASFRGRARAAVARGAAPCSRRGTTPRAQVYRRAHDIPDDIGTAVNVVQMVFGNKGDRSGTGVAFTRDPSTGERGCTASSSPTRRARTSSPASGRRSRSRRCARRCRRRSTSCSRRCAGSRSTTATCRTSSSRSRTSSCTCCRRARRSARPRPR